MLWYLVLMLDRPKYLCIQIRKLGEYGDFVACIVHKSMGSRERERMKETPLANMFTDQAMKHLFGWLTSFGWGKHVMNEQQ